MNRIRPHIDQLEPYTPGEQPSYRDTAAGLANDAGQGGVLKLNTNENPYPPSPRVLQAIRELPAEALRLYPPADSKLLRGTAAKLHGVEPNQIIATNGGDELLRLLITVCCEAGTGKGGIGMSSPSYTLYQVLAAIHDTPVTVVDREGEGFALPENYISQLNAAGCRLAFIVNPHAPTGQWVPIDRLRQMAEAFHGVLVIDEAYADFAPGNAIELVSQCDNVVILRSFSKGYSLAGMRIGYGITSTRIIEALQKVRDSYNIDIVAQAAAVAALEDQEYLKHGVEQVKSSRSQLIEELRQRGFDTPESHSNFVLAAVPGDGESEQAQFAKSIYQQMKNADILIRYFDRPRLSNRLRITVGTDEGHHRLLGQLDRILDRKMQPS
jgi:histidinol-phosphate aminotransferase